MCSMSWMDCKSAAKLGNLDILLLVLLFRPAISFYFHYCFIREHLWRVRSWQHVVCLQKTEWFQLFFCMYIQRLGIKVHSRELWDALTLLCWLTLIFYFRVLCGINLTKTSNEESCCALWQTNGYYGFCVWVSVEFLTRLCCHSLSLTTAHSHTAY